MQTGDLIHRRTGRSEFGSHYGVAVVYADGTVDVIHRKKDNDGVMEPLEDFLKGYPLLRARPTPLSGASAQQLIDRFRSFDAGTYDLLRNNCEHYAYRFSRYRPVITDTDRRIIVGIMATVLVLSFILRP